MEGLICWIFRELTITRREFSPGMGLNADVMEEK